MQLAVYTALFLSLITSSLAYLVKAPNDNQGWHSGAGGHTITWNRVDTDANAFAVALTRVQPPYYSLIYPYVNGGTPDVDHSFDIPPPKGGFPVGQHFRVNLVDVQNHGTIYAQSNEFTIQG